MGSPVEDSSVFGCFWKSPLYFCCFRVGSAAFLDGGRQLEVFLENGNVFWKSGRIRQLLYHFLPAVSKFASRLSFECFSGEIWLSLGPGTNYFSAFHRAWEHDFQGIAVEPEREAEFGLLWRLVRFLQELLCFLVVSCDVVGIVSGFRQVLYWFLPAGRCLWMARGRQQTV